MNLGRDEIGYATPPQHPVPDETFTLASSLSELRNSLDTIRLETDKQAGFHTDLAEKIRTDLEAQCSAFLTRQSSFKRTIQATIEKEFKTKNTQESYVNKAREKYESDCVRINSYTAQSVLMQGKDLDRINAKLERTQQTVQANEKDFANFSRALQETVQKWEQDWKAFCDACQDMEDDRLEFMKDNMWGYANAVSTVCVADDEVGLTIFILNVVGMTSNLVSPAKRYELPSNSSNLKGTWRILFVTMVQETRYQIPPSSSTTPILMPSPLRLHGRQPIPLTSFVLPTAPTSPDRSLFPRPKRNRTSTTMSLVSDLDAGTRYRLHTRLSTAPPVSGRLTGTAQVVPVNRAPPR